jgi:hypothetical protein
MDDSDFFSLEFQLDEDGSNVTIYPEGETWESLHGQACREVEEIGSVVLRFYDDVIAFLFADDAIKHKDFIIEIQLHKRIAKHLIKQIHSS